MLQFNYSFYGSVWLTHTDLALYCILIKIYLSVNLYYCFEQQFFIKGYKRFIFKCVHKRRFTFKCVPEFNYLMVFNKMAIARLRRLRDRKLHNASRNYQKKEDLQNNQITKFSDYDTIVT